MQRQFVNLVVNCCRSGSLVLRRINCASLFHHPPGKQNGGGRTKKQQTMVKVAELPEPALSFDSTYRRVMLMPLGCNADKILSVDEDGIIVAYDACLNKVRGMPELKGRMQNSLPIGVGDSLYLIKKCPDKCTEIFEGCSFQALINSKPPPTSAYRHGGWSWHPLPPPPYVEDPMYERVSTYRIRCYAVVDGKIWITAKGIGTYVFNTARRQWSKAGSWELPFRGGGAEYVPELDRWIGFTGDQENRLLCALDLRTTAGANNGGAAAPTPCRVWEQELAIPEDWQLWTSHLARVDSGRFCIARFFYVREDDDYSDGIKENFAIFTGVEVTKADEELQMAVHKSVRYNFDGLQGRALVIPILPAV